MGGFMNRLRSADNDPITARPLLTPDEIRSLPAHTQLLFLAGQRPIVAGKLAYYADLEFKGMFDAA
jgi:type IV secretion system protein VirD4